MHSIKKETGKVGSPKANEPKVTGVPKSETEEEGKTDKVKKPKAVTVDKDFEPGQSGTVK